MQKKKYSIKLHSRDIDCLVSCIGIAIEAEVRKAYEDGYRLDTYEGLKDNLEELLTLLNELFKHEPYTNYYDLPKQLGLVKRQLKFPLLIEEYYQDYLKRNVELYLKIPPCEICGEPTMQDSASGLLIHKDCPAKYGWYKCRKCKWLYPKNLIRCNRKPDCNKYSLIKIS